MNSLSSSIEVQSLMILPDDSNNPNWLNRIRFTNESYNIVSIYQEQKSRPQVDALRIKKASIFLIEQFDLELVLNLELFLFKPF